MSHVGTWRGNDIIALGSDANFDYPLGGFYTASSEASIAQAAPSDIRHISSIFRGGRNGL